MPNGNHLNRVREIGARLIEEDVAEPTAENDPQGAPDNEVVDLRLGHDFGRRRGYFPHVSPPDQDARNIRNCIPTNGERAEPDRDRIDIGEMEGGHADTRLDFEVGQR